jgi:Icc protein
MNIIQITDCHLFSDSNATMAGVNTGQTLLKVLNEISENELADLILVTGDMAHDEELPTYQQLKGFLDKLKINYYLLPGNHDQPQYLKKVFEDHFIGQFQHFISDGWQIILLSTANAGKVSGRLNEQQLALLSKVMHENCDPTVIFMHHHAVPVKCPWLDDIGLEQPDDFFAILKSTSSVKAVFCGHVHQEFMHQRDNIIFYGTPSTCFQFKPHSEMLEYDNALPAYRSINFNASGLFDTHVIRVEI